VTGRPLPPSGRNQQRDRGSATIESVVVLVVLLVPLTYVVLTGLQLQRAAFAATQAARTAARAFITAPTGGMGRVRADRAVRLAVADQGARIADLQLRIECSADPCLSPGGVVRVQVSGRVELPWVPDMLGRAAAVPVTAIHTESVDPFREQRR
jgi:hypothetical protein